MLLTALFYMLLYPLVFQSITPYLHDTELYAQYVMCSRHVIDHKSMRQQ